MAKRNWCGRWNYFRAVVFLFCLRWTTKCDLGKFALCDICFFSNFYCIQIMGYLCQKVKKKKKLGVIELVSEFKRVET